MKTFLLLLLQILTIIANSSSVTQCSTFIQNKNMYSNALKSHYFMECIQALIEQHKTEQINQIQNLISKEDQSVFIQTLEKQIKNLEAIEDYVVITKSTCEPTLKWAQNTSHIFIAAKLSHRWDSPPCLKSVSQKYELSNSTILFSNICLMNNVQINFYISERLYKDAIDNISIKKDGVGTYSIIIQKLTAQIWPFLFIHNKSVSMWEQVMDRDNTTRSQYFEARKVYQQEQAKLAKSDI